MGERTKEELLHEKLVRGWQMKEVAKKVLAHPSSSVFQTSLFVKVKAWEGIEVVSDKAYDDALRAGNELYLALDRIQAASENLPPELNKEIVHVMSEWFDCLSVEESIPVAKQVTKPKE